MDLQSLFERSLDCSIKAMERITGGRNSQVFKLLGSNDKQYVAKLYYRDQSDPRDRLTAEFNGLSFLWRNQIRTLPRPILADPDNGFSIYEYVEGYPLKSAEITCADIDAAVFFLIQLDVVGLSSEAANLPRASEACFSLTEIVENLQLRFDRLAHIDSGEILADELHRFTAKDFEPFFMHIKKWSEAKALMLGAYPQFELPRSDQTLSPSDFGFHNALRQPDGKLIFLDFEYFGWDDPAKMTVDFILHPGMNLRKELQQHFIHGIMRHFTQKKGFIGRLSSVYPLFGIKWCLILLNEFVAKDKARRDFAQNTPSEIGKRRELQLLKAKKMFREVTQNYERAFGNNTDPAGWLDASG